MRIFVALFAALAFAFSAGAQTSSPAKSPDAKSTAEKAGGKKKAEPPPKIEGMEIARPNGGFLGLQIVNSTFKLSFYGKDKKPVPADITGAVLRWTPRNKKGDERVLLTVSADGKALTSPRVIQPPHQFKLFITLLKDDTATGENYVIDYQS